MLVHRHNQGPSRPPRLYTGCVGSTRPPAWNRQRLEKEAMGGMRPGQNEYGAPYGQPERTVRFQEVRGAGRGAREAGWFGARESFDL